jgi:5-methylcytosine-specific restriction endonuclease McrA
MTERKPSVPARRRRLRACLCGAVDCQRHQRRAWARVPKARTLSYADPVYQRNRLLAIKREPICHWCHVRPSTTADHLRSVASRGGHELENLVGACSKCNERRGGAEGRATQKRRPR